MSETPKSLQDLQRLSQPIQSKALLRLLRLYLAGKLPPGHDGWRLLTKQKLWDNNKREWSLAAKVTLNALQGEKKSRQRQGGERHR
jgi:hypothetical protein